MILDRFRLDGQVAVVTGGTRGLGRAIACALAEAGADIVTVSRRDHPDAAAEIRAVGRRYRHLAADLTQRDDVHKVIPNALAEMGTVDVLVNSAGIIRRKPAEAHPEGDWDATIEIDLSAVFVLSQAAGRVMLEKGRGKIINVGSVLSFQGGINVVSYAAAKHGLVGLTKALANEWASRGININALAPSFFETDLTDALQQDPERYQSITDRTPAGRWGQPEDIAGAAVFLASPASDFVNGVVLPVDGGWLAR